MTTLFEKPESASSGVRTPDIIKARRAQSATMSERTFPETKKADATTSMISVITIVSPTYLF